MGAESDWEPRAVCRDLDPDLFFEPKRTAAAKAACARCPVTAECLEAVLVREEGLSAGYRSGIFAGLAGGERATVAKQKGLVKARAKKRTPGPVNSKAECGTTAAYSRHLRNKEAVDDECREAHARSRREYRRSGSTKVPAAQ